MNNMHIAWPEDSPYDQAAYWLTRLRSETCSDIDHKAFGHWIKESPENQEAFEALLEAWHNCSVLSEEADLLQIRRKALRPARPQKWRGLFAGFAALFLIGFFVITQSERYIQRVTPTTEKEQVNLSQTTASLSFSTAIGERSSIHLDDGSIVELNTDTEVLVKFSQFERRLILEKGQALFNVAHDTDRPFVVYAGDRRVTALGTEFEVKFDTDDVAAVTLFKGAVKIDELDIKSEAQEPRVMRTVELAPGQRLAKITIPEIVPEDVLNRSLGWREGKLVFDGEKLGDVILEINRYSLRKVVLADSELTNLPISGNFHAGSSEGFAAAVSNYYNLVKINDDENQKIIIRRK